MTNIETSIWHWYHNVSECFYHIQLTIKYRKVLFEPNVEQTIVESVKDVKERYAIEIHNVGFDQNHVHFLVQFLPKYSSGQVIKLLKSISAKAVFANHTSVKQVLRGGEFWTDGYYIATISGRGNRKVIEQYIKKQGRDAGQLRLF